MIECEYCGHDIVELSDGIAFYYSDEGGSYAVIFHEVCAQHAIESAHIQLPEKSISLAQAAQIKLPEETSIPEEELDDFISCYSLSLYIKACEQHKRNKFYYHEQPPVHNMH